MSEYNPTPNNFRIVSRPEMTLEEVSEFDGPATRTPHVERLHAAEHAMSHIGTVQLYDRAPHDSEYISIGCPSIPNPTGKHPAYVLTTEGDSVLRKHLQPIFQVSCNVLQPSASKKKGPKLQDPNVGSLGKLASNPNRSTHLIGYETFSDAVISVSKHLVEITEELVKAASQSTHELHREASVIRTSDIIDRRIDGQGNYIQLPGDIPIERLPELMSEAIEFSKKLSTHARQTEAGTMLGESGYIFNNRTNVFIGFLTDLLRHPQSSQILALSGDTMIKYLTRPGLNYAEHISRMYAFAQKLYPSLPDRVDVNITRTSGAKLWAIDGGDDSETSRLFDLLIDKLMKDSLIHKNGSEHFEITVIGSRGIDDTTQREKIRNMINALAKTRHLSRILKSFAIRKGDDLPAEPFYTLSTLHRLDQTNINFRADMITAPTLLEMRLDDVTTLTEALGELMLRQKFIR